MEKNSIIVVFNAMFKNKKNWINISDEDKSQYFFIFNRYLSKKYVNEAKLLNNKMIDKVTGMNLWFHFMFKKPYPDFFWSKSEKSKNSDVFSDKEIKLLLISYNLKIEELEFLIKYFPEEVKEELKYTKLTNNIK